jgi:GntR family transcriptional regulator of abcA and norABC
MKNTFAFKLDRSSSEPIYRQIAEGIRGLVATGELNPGQRLPAIRKLAAELEVAPLTVHDAYQLLKRQKLVDSLVGRGTSIAENLGTSEGIEFLRQVPQRKLDNRFESVASQSGLRSMASGIADVSLFPADEFVAEIDELRSGHEWSFYYSHGYGAQPYLEALASLLTSMGLKSSAADFVATLGARNGIGLVVSEFLPASGRVIIEGYQSLSLDAVWEIHRLDVVTVKRNHQRPDFDALLAIDDAHAIYVSPTGCGSTGRTMLIEDRIRLLDIAKAKKWIVIEDASYGLLTYAAPPPALAALDSSVVQIGSFACSLAPGLRLGYIRSSEAMRERLSWRIQAEDAGGPLFVQLAFAAFVKRKRLQAHLERVIPKYLARRDALLLALQQYLSNDATWYVPDAGLSVGVTLNEPVDELALLDKCITKGFAFTPGSALTHPDDANRFLRFSFGAQPREAFAPAIEAFAKILQSMR